MKALALMFIKINYCLILINAYPFKLDYIIKVYPYHISIFHSWYGNNNSLSTDYYIKRNISYHLSFL